MASLVGCEHYVRSCLLKVRNSFYEQVLIKPDIKTHMLLIVLYMLICVANVFCS